MGEEFLRSEGPRRDGELRRRLDLLDPKDPVDSYLLLSDEAQDEIEGRHGQDMKCLSCGHRFKGDILDKCPKCHSSMTEEIGILDEEW